MSPTTDDQSSQIRYILTAALDSPPLSKETADTAVERINRLYPNLQSNQEIEDFIWKLWSVLLSLVKGIATGDERMSFLVTFIQQLKSSEVGSVSIWGETIELWGSLPLFGAVIREEWNLNPIANESSDEKEISAWISINSFIARLHGASVITYTNYAIWSLRSALEERLDAAWQTKCAVSTAHEWIVHAGPALYKGSQSPEKLDEAAQRSLRGGELTKAGPGLSVERWAFWKARLEELGRGDGGEKAEGVVGEMIEIEGGY